MEQKIKIDAPLVSRLSLGPITYLGGFFWVWNQPGFGFWDGVIWLWYVGRYIAAHFAMLHYTV